MTFFQTNSLLSLTEQKILDEIINTNDESNLSIRNRIISTITFPIYWIATCIENLAWRFVDPNWKYFVVKGQGHFVKSKHNDTFNAALTKMDEIFKANIDSCTDIKEWQLVHKNKRSIDNQSQIWSQFKNGGTCFGNCLSLAHNIIKSGRLLTIDELKKIENSEILVATSQAVQLVANSVVEYNKTIFSNGLAELKKTTSLKERLSSLGLTVEEYEKNNSQSRINSLIDNGITKNDLSTTLEQLLSLDPFPFAFTLLPLKREALKRHMIKPGLELIKPFKLLPLENMGKVSSIQVSNFKNTLNEESSLLITPDFKGVMLINGIPIEGRVGHMMLLEADSKKGIYIFYDNNRGYYQWNDLQSCLLGIETRLKSENYSSCEIVLNTLI